MADELKQTLLPVSGRVEDIVVHDGQVTQGHQATAAELTDGLDTTYDATLHQDAGGVGPSADTFVEWTLTPVTYTGTISFLRFKYRTRLVVSAGSDPRPGGCTLKAAEREGTVNYSDNTLYEFPDAFAITSIDLTGNMIDTSTWTAAHINAHKFGWFVSDDDAGPVTANYTTYISEFSVEIWGPASPTHVTGSTTYTTGFHDAGINHEDISADDLARAVYRQRRRGPEY